MSLLDTTASVETPERVSFRYELSGPGRRAVAWAIDALLRLVLLSTVVVLLVALNVLGFQSVTEASLGLLLLVLFVLEWLYGVIFELAFGGRTPGKAIVGVRVVRVDGSPASLSDLVLRNLLRAVDYLPLWPVIPGFDLFTLPTFAVGACAMLLDPKLRRVGDIVGGTVVVIESGQQLQAVLQIDPPISREELESLPPHVDLSAEERRTIEALLRRRSKLSAARAEELAAMYAPTISERTGVSAPTALRVLALAYARSHRATP